MKRRWLVRDTTHDKRIKKILYIYIYSSRNFILQINILTIYRYIYTKFIQIPVWHPTAKCTSFQYLPSTMPTAHCQRYPFSVDPDLLDDALAAVDRRSAGASSCAHSDCPYACWCAHNMGTGSVMFWAPDKCTRTSGDGRVLSCWHTNGNSTDRDADRLDTSLQSGIVMEREIWIRD